MVGGPRNLELGQVNSDMHPSRVAKSSISFGWGRGGKVTNTAWQVTLCDPIWHVISRGAVVISITNCYIRVYFTDSTSSIKVRDRTTQRHNNHIAYHFHSCPRFLNRVKAASNMSPISDAAMYQLAALPVTTASTQTDVTPCRANIVRTSIARVTMNQPILHHFHVGAHAHHVHRKKFDWPEAVTTLGVG